MKVMIVGAGGVGGYIAGCLSRIYKDITLIARGEHLQAIRENGLRVIDCDSEFTTHPFCTDTPAEAGVQDAILFCTKSYGLFEAVEQVRPCVGEGTLLIPLLNGISARRVIREKLDKGIALDGSIKIFSQIQAPGVIIKGSAINATTMGAADGPAPESLHTLCGMLVKAGIQAEVSDDIQRVMWMKWCFILSSAQAGSYYNVTVGEMRDDPAMYKLVFDLLDEVLRVARAENVNLPDNIVEYIHTSIMDTRYDSTPSLMRDLNTPGKPTELDIFGGELCRLADKHHIDAPYNRMILERFGDRI